MLCYASMMVGSSVVFVCLVVAECRREKHVMPEMTFAEMKVPRRPQWTTSTTAEELNRLEKESFLEWRRDIAL